LDPVDKWGLQAGSHQNGKRNKNNCSGTIKTLGVFGKLSTRKDGEQEGRLKRTGREESRGKTNPDKKIYNRRKQSS